MHRQIFLTTLVIGLAIMTFSACADSSQILSQQKARLPNFVVIFADDLGYADIGSFGAKGFFTPNLDRMAAEGMRFTSFYVAQGACSASRAALLTGCYPNRIGIPPALSPQAEIGLASGEMTIAEILKKKGYVSGIFGKWHLGHHPRFLPLQHGFDEYLGLPYSNDMWPWDYDNTLAPPDHRKAKHPWLPLIENNRKIAELKRPQDQDKLTTLYTERAVRFIEEHKQTPFFLYVPHSMPHTPLGVSEKFRGKSEQGRYGDVIMEIDWSVGRILEALNDHGLDQHTLVIFTSDNGPWLNFGDHAGSAYPLREGKGSSWDGGVRVPCIMRWPGRIPSASVCNQIVTTMDLLPTMSALTGASLPKHPIDGVNILSLLEAEPGAAPREHFYYYYGNQLQCIRKGNWKLHFPHSYRSYQGVEPGTGGLPGPYSRGETGLELYDLANDIGETHNLVKRYPEIVRDLQSLGEKARRELGDRDLPGQGVRPPGKR
ncbi:MAG: sulfatase-like hydrolase/transferase [Candidatus Aminicenantes bacterium]|nr:sulfatase-like hydrolase/transferase [Candidatus Aminicenantes bacterium]